MKTVVITGSTRGLGLEMAKCFRKTGWRLQNKFHVSAAEIDEQDTHQTIVIGVAAIVPHNAMADSLMENISLFVEENTDAEIIDEEREIR